MPLYLTFLKGNSRSACVVIGYLMWKKSLSFADAMSLVRQKRGFIDPNLGFVGQLMDFDAIFRHRGGFSVDPSTNSKVISPSIFD
jgi:hypothetical protein